MNEKSGWEKWKVQWERFKNSNARIYIIVGLMFYALLVGFPFCIYVSWFGGSGWWTLNLFAPGFIGMFLWWHGGNEVKAEPHTPERLESSLESTEEVWQCAQAWMEAGSFTEIHEEQRDGVALLWGQRYRRIRYSVMEIVAVMRHEGAYSEEKEWEIVGSLIKKTLENTNRTKTRKVNGKIWVIDCIEKRQASLTKALSQQAQGEMDLLLRCGYVERDQSFRIQFISKDPFNNQSMLKKMRKSVLKMFEGKLTPIQEEKKKEPGHRIDS